MDEFLAKQRELLYCINRQFNLDIDERRVLTWGDYCSDDVDVFLTDLEYIKIAMNDTFVMLDTHYWFQGRKIKKVYRDDKLLMFKRFYEAKVFKAYQQRVMIYKAEDYVGDLNLKEFCPEFEILLSC